MNNSTSEIELIYTVIYAFGAFFLMAIAVVVFIYYARKKIIQKELEKKNLEIAYQKEMLNAAILTQEKERKRIARDLHHDISSKINIISLCFRYSKCTTNLVFLLYRLNLQLYLTMFSV